MKLHTFFPLQNHKNFGMQGWLIARISVFGLTLFVSLALLGFALPAFAASDPSSSPTTPNTTSDDPGTVPTICPILQQSDSLATPFAGPPPLIPPKFIIDDQHNILGFIQLYSCNRQVFGAVTAFSQAPQPMSVFLTIGNVVQSTAFLTGTYVHTPPQPFDTANGYCAKGTITIEYGHSFSNTVCDN